MKKLLVVSMAVLLATLLIVSCDSEQKIEENGLAVISFDASEAVSRSLTREYESFDASNLYWYYTAEKKDSTGLTTGVATTKTAVNENKTGLKTVGPFSYGDWEFVLYGCTDAAGTKVAYEGKATITIKKATTTLTVFVTAQQAGTGTLEFPAKKDIVKLNNGTTVTLGTDIIERITFSCLNDSSKTQTKYDYATMLTVNTSLRSISLDSGSYAVTFSYLKGVTSTTNEGATAYDDTNAYAVAEETIYVSIKDNQTTTISGNISENTGEVNPAAVEAEAKIVTASSSSTTTTFYDSFLAAIEAYSYSESSEIILLKDVTISASRAFDSNLTIDLGGKILTLGSDVDLTIGSSSVTADSPITVTIKNGTIDGEGYLINDNYNASLKLEGVTFAANRKSTWSGSKINNTVSGITDGWDSWTGTDEQKNLAKSYIEWFDKKFVETGKASTKLEEIDAKNKKLIVTVYNADLFASCDLIYDYWRANHISERHNGDHLVSYCDIIIDADLDLDDKEWTPINGKVGSGLVFDFNKHTISNLQITSVTTDNVGLFSSKSGGEIRNLTITNAEVSASNSNRVGILMGSVTSEPNEPCKISNITVTNSTLKGNKYVGVIAGQGYVDSISGCSVENVTIEAGAQVGGIFGDFKLGTIANCKVSNSTIIATNNCAGGIAGKPYCCEGGTVNIKNNTVSNTIIGIGTDKDNLTATPTANIGCKDNYCGYIAGGRYINATDNAKDNIIYEVSAGTTIIDSSNTYSAN